MGFESIAIEIAKGITTFAMGNVVQDSISAVSLGNASQEDKDLAKAFYNKLNEKRKLAIESQIEYHRGCIRILTKQKMLPPRIVP